MLHGLIRSSWRAALSQLTASFVLFGCMSLWVPSAAAAEADGAPEPTPEQIAFFENKIRPILVENCYKCHASEKQSGELRLDSRDALMVGGDSGSPIVPGKPEESLLIEAVKYESFEMPPGGKLKDSEIEALTEWVRIGAPWPKEHGSSQGGPALRKNRDKITDEDRAWWAFQPVQNPPVPVIPDDQWSRNPVDRFLLARMHAEGLSPAPEADRATLIRRVYFDLIGLPPTPEEIEAFVADERPEAYELLVDRLLASPHYGERWGRHWLDVVRYAESDGYRQDAYRPIAWKYRDYVVRSFNADKPYPQFVREQLAGDEIPGGGEDAMVATGFLRLGMYEYNQRDVKGQWALILNEITDVTADTFLGMGMGCARCHDHKFDPILQKDYFRLQAFFTPLSLRDDLPATSTAELNEYHRQLAIWEEKTAEIRKQLDEIERPHRESAAKKALSLFPEDCQDFLYVKPEERTPYQEQIFQLANRQAILAANGIDFKKTLKGEVLERWTKLKEELAKFDADKPKPLPLAYGATDVGPQAPPTTVPNKSRMGEIEPGVLTVLDPNPLPIPPSPNSLTTGRRTALAAWISNPSNPLTPRVMVNRIWQHHFGRGLAESPSDFGRLGEAPTHPELLDWLAVEFMNHGWCAKHMHRLIVTSTAYRQASHGPELATLVQQDPSNKWLSRMTVRRLAAEQVRDAALVVTGELNPKLGGEGADKIARRSIYLKVIRNRRDDFLEVFDVPDGTSSMPVRNVTTTPTQALTMINGPFMLYRSKILAGRIEKATKGSENLREAQVNEAYRLVFGRKPSSEELSLAEAFLAEGDGKPNERLADFCHVLLNSNEFLYVD
jgi:hypothetical protein